MNAPLRRLALALGLLFLALLTNATWVQVGQAHDLNHRADNPRPLLTRLTTDRGQIQLGDGTVLATSVLSKDGRTYDRVYSPDPATHRANAQQAALYADVTGWAGVISTSGIEQSEDDLLAGNDDRLAIRNFTDTLAGKQKQGGSVQLTLDKAGQQAAYTSLQRALGSSGNAGAVVALDVQTGKVLVMVSVPSFDPNPIASRDGAAAQQAYEGLLKQPGNPLFNRATQGRYPPGSMFKLVTSAAALSTDKYTPSTQIDAPATYTPPLTRVAIPNFAGELCGSGGKESLLDALATSCNTAFAKLGVALGQAKLQRQAAAFGIGAATPSFPLPWARSTFASGELDPPALAQSAIGQRDVALTPLQAAMIVQAIGNGGHLITPYLVDKELAPDKSELSTGHGTDVGQVVTPQVADELTQMMQAVVQKGTAAEAGFNAALKVAGKTGTAQHGTNPQGVLLPPDTWFAGFNTAGNRRVAVVAFVENGGTQGSAAQGATVAAPIVRDVMNALVTPPGQ